MLVVAVNYAPNRSQCHVSLPLPDPARKKWQLRDRLSPARYEWNGDDLQGRGMYLDMAPWQACAFSRLKYMYVAQSADLRTFHMRWMYHV